MKETDNKYPLRIIILCLKVWFIYAGNVEHSTLYFLIKVESFCGRSYSYKAHWKIVIMPFHFTYNILFLC